MNKNIGQIENGSIIIDTSKQAILGNVVSDFEPTISYNKGDKVMLNGEINEVTGVGKSTIEMEVLPLGAEDCGERITGTMPNKSNIICGINPNKLKMRVKYFEGATKLQKITKGNWIDVFANKDIFVPVGERAMIPLGFALELPQGWEGHLAPRSSTFKTWGIIQTNHVGVVDDTYIGDNDQWHMPVYCLQGKGYQDCVEGTMILKGDKIGQFRIMEVMPEIEFDEVESFGNTDRGGFGTTSSR
jgi:dUTP pyrophosphatase